MNNLLLYLQSLTSLSSADWELLQPVLTPLAFKKGTHLLREGEVCNALYYINRGYCRSYHLKDGLEKNTAFYFENDIATNIQSFGAGTPSVYNIVACEPLQVIAFNKQRLFEAAQQSAGIETLGRKCIRLFAIRQEEQASLLQRYTPGERYDWLVQHQPEMLQRVSLSQLSSYLGVARETLSRIRKRNR